MSDTNRKTWLDVARILAIFSVIVVHVTADGWYGLDVRTREWEIYNIYYGITRCWGVPVFLMISGTLFLNPDRKIDMRMIFSKNIVRMVSAYLVWAFLYAMMDYCMGEVFTIQGFLQKILVGHYHMWYIPMIVGVYLLIPILRKIVEDKCILQYFVVLSVVFEFGMGTMNIIPVLSDVYVVFDRLLVKMVTGYVVYFVL